MVLEVVRPLLVGALLHMSRDAVEREDVDSHSKSHRNGQASRSIISSTANSRIASHSLWWPMQRRLGATRQTLQLLKLWSQLHRALGQLPTDPPHPSPTQLRHNDYLREYLSVMDAMGYDTGPYTWEITPTQWATGHNIWVFKVTPGPIGGLHSKQLNGDLRLEMKFSPQLAGNVTLLLLSEEPATLEIDQFNHVLIYLNTLLALIMRGEAIDKILIDVLWGTPTTYLGVFSRDQLPHSFTRYPSSYGANTDDSYLPRQNLVAFNHLSPSHIEFLDSYGCAPDDFPFPFPPTITQIDMNSHQIQSDNSFDCGQYSIFYLYQRAHDIPLREIIKALPMTSNPALFVRTFHSKLRSRIILCSLDHCCCTHQSCTPKH